uniref:hypothetical protein n=1 Tax=Cyanobium sp. TaxID=2164130 RepID=UPI0040471C33
MFLPSEPWNLATCSALQQRDALVRFWLAAPADQLEALWASPCGRATCELVRQLNAQHPFTPEQVSLRGEIGTRFNQGGLSQPLAPQLMLANFLLSPPGLLCINNAEQFFPTWLVAAYRELYEVGAPAAAATPQPPAVPAQPALMPVPQAPDFGAFPASLHELVGNRIQLNRLLGLSNLYYIDPEDQEIRQELEQVRSNLVDAIDRCPEAQLEQLWSTDLGDRFWALVRSGIQKENLSPADEVRKQAAVRRLDSAAGGGFSTPGSTNAFLITMVYFLPGTMRVDGAEQKLPAWLLPQYQQVFAQALPA